MVFRVLRHKLCNQQLNSSMTSDMVFTPAFAEEFPHRAAVGAKHRFSGTLVRIVMDAARVKIRTKRPHSTARADRL